MSFIYSIVLFYYSISKDRLLFKYTWSNIELDAIAVRKHISF